MSARLNICSYMSEEVSSAFQEGIVSHLLHLTSAWNTYPFQLLRLNPYTGEEQVTAWPERGPHFSALSDGSMTFVYLKGKYTDNEFVVNVLLYPLAKGFEAGVSLPDRLAPVVSNPSWVDLALSLHLHLLDRCDVITAVGEEFDYPDAVSSVEEALAAAVQYDLALLITDRVVTPPRPCMERYQQGVRLFQFVETSY